MKTKDIIIQLQAELPKYTPLFSNTLPVSSITFLGGIVTVTTPSAHNLNTNDTVVIKDALSPNPITSLTASNGIATAETLNDHDLTEGWPNGVGSTINITGALDSQYNGDVTLLRVPNRQKFTYSIDTSAPATTTGGVLNEVLNFGYNGFFQITVTGANAFTYPVTRSLGSPATGTPALLAKTRISGGVNIEKLIASYTKQNTSDLYGFVVLNDSVANKSRHTNNDADKTRGSGNDPYQKIIESFKFYVFANTKDEIAARKARDLMDDIRNYVFKSIMGFKPPTNLESGKINGLTYVNDGVFLYGDSFYIHQFEFQSFVDVIFDDTLKINGDVAFRNIDLEFIDPLVSDGDDVIMTANIDLDEEPV